jgi:predicted AlkP superfamily phosphohydrolase/phosphomutase
LIFVLGIDAATWTVIRPNLDSLPAFKRLTEIGQAKEITLGEKEVLKSQAIWCGMFCGKTPEEHGHKEWVVDGELVKREDIKVDFIWDILDREGKKVRVINVPFVAPSYSFNVDFRPVGFGMPINEREWQEELEKVTETTKKLLAEQPDLLIAVYTLLDRIQHFHWGEALVLEWYRKLDRKLDEIIFGTGFLDKGQNMLIIISDHGMCSFGEARVQTLPKKTEWGELKGDHHENAVLITVNVDYPIEKPQDIFQAVMKDFGMIS